MPTSRVLSLLSPHHQLTRLTASVAMPSIAAPPTPSTSRALDSTKSMAVPMPLSSFLPLRGPAPAISPGREHQTNGSQQGNSSCCFSAGAQPFYTNLSSRPPSKACNFAHRYGYTDCQPLVIDEISRASEYPLSDLFLTTIGTRYFKDIRESALQTTVHHQGNNSSLPPDIYFCPQGCWVWLSYKPCITQMLMFSYVCTLFLFFFQIPFNLWPLRLNSERFPGQPHIQNAFCHCSAHGWIETERKHQKTLPV